MGLGMFLLGKVVDHTMDKHGDKILTGAAILTVGAAVLPIAAPVALAGKAIEKAGEVRKEKNAKKELEKRDVPEKRIETNNHYYSQYDLHMECAKVAICSYIINADRRVTKDEKNYLDQMLNHIKNEMGPEAFEKVRKAYKECAGNFMNVESYVKKVRQANIKSFVMAAEEIAKLDGCEESELVALEKIRKLIDPNTSHLSENKMVCEACGGLMHLDEYGYKANCTFCGWEMLIDSYNAPLSSFRK